MSNRLRGQASVYLRQHSENPVAWFEWSEEAFEKARSEEKLVFLSVGYSSCHWCHVMEHECFEDDEIAEILNRSFVSIKVDREERPDVDEAYMTFVQMLAGRGGWPMSVFLLPDKSPFFGGTYWPKQDRGGHAGFRSILLRLEQLWKESREEIVGAADYYTQGLKDAVSDQSKGSGMEIPAMDHALDQLRSSFDTSQGGFGGAPKFPPHAALELLLSIDSTEEMASFTLKKMCLGGIHDHVGGGFHRYSTDSSWHLPHFEKMLYDNALLLKNLALAGSANEEFKRAAEGIVNWVSRDLTSPEGLFYSAMDADSEGEEGKYYVWKYREILELAKGKRFAESYGCQPPGNFYEEATGLLTGENVLHRREKADPETESLRELLNRRASRKPPVTDDKCLVCWNGLMISGLAAANRRDLASVCADALLRWYSESGDLPRFIWRGSPVGEGFLEDYAYLALALFELGGHEVMADSVCSEMVRRFYDEEEGGFFGTAAHGERLFGRTKPVLDQPIPSANSAAIRCLIYAGDEARAAQSLNVFGGWMTRVPMACEALFTTLLFYERTFGKLSARARPTLTLTSAAFEEGVLSGSFDLELPKGWRVNLEDGSPVLTARANSQPLPLTLDQAGRLIHATFRRPLSQAPQEVVVSYQLCTESECLAVAHQALPFKISI